MMENRTAARVNDKGFTVLFEADNSIIDIFFVHGFTGDPKETWTSKKCSKSPKKHRLESDEIEKHNDTIGSKPSKIRKLFFSSTKQSQHAIFPTAPPTIAPGQNNNASEAGGEEVYWPRDLLPHTIHGARIATYGYDTKVRHFATGGVSQNTVHDHGRNFLCALEELRRKEPLRPLLLVAHSLGGLVVSETLKKSRDCEFSEPHLYNVVSSVVGVLFFGTPHRGADPRGLLHRVLTPFVRGVVQGVGFELNDRIVDTLMPGGEHLKEMRDAFIKLARQDSWIVYCFQEEYGLPEFFNKKAVEDESSRLDDPAIETLRHISRNHRDMCRFSGFGDPEYQKVVAAIDRILQSISRKLQPGLVIPSDMQSANSNSNHTSGILPPWRSTKNMNEMDYTGHVPKGSDCGPAEPRQILIDLLRFDQIDARLLTLKSAQVRTCQWFLQKPEYTDWMSAEKLPEHHGFLWVKGKPGAGKSILMKFLFSKAKKSAESDPNKIVISFFFNARGDRLEMSTVGLYRSLLIQILQIAPDLQGVLDGLDYSARHLIQEHGWQIEILKEMLVKVVEALGKRTLILFIDALDECHEDQAADMISFFEDIGERAAEAKTRLHICFSSRHYPTILIQRGFELTLEDENEHAADITRYIKSNLKLVKSNQAEALRAEILEKSARIFLWVALVIPILNREYGKGHVSALRDRLKAIPPGLDELFEMILTRDCEEMLELRLCTQWILFAMRPLKPQELYFAVHIGIGQTMFTSWDTDSITIDDIRRFVQSSSKGLAEVTKSKEPTVQFIHESVRDFLLGKGGETLWPSFSEQLVGHSHDLLKKCCLAQINTTRAIEDLQQPALTKYPFLEYATTNVLMHSNQAQSGGAMQEEFINAFPLQHWIELNNSFEKFKSRCYTSQADLLYILAERNCASLIQIHPHTPDHFVTHGERYAYPLIAAVVLRNEDAVRELLRAVLPNQPDLLLDLRGYLDRFPPGRDFQCSRDYELLSFFEHFNHERMLRYLLETRAVVFNSKNKAGRTALSLAAERGFILVAGLLLAQSDIEINSKDKRERTPLLWAAEKGHEAVVKLLIEKGADLESKDNTGETPLLWAVLHGRDTVVKLLIKKGADLESKNCTCETPLSMAVLHGRDTVVKLLIENGADLESKDNIGETPLLRAARWGQAAIVKLLIENGADLESKDNYGRTPLSFAAEHGREAVVKLLIEKDADLESKDHQSRTPLLWVARWGQDAVAKLLIEKGADLESKDNTGETPLLWAARWGQAAIVKLLIENGADLESKDNYGRTPLSFAAKHGRKAVWKLLIEMGAKISQESDLVIREK